MSQPCLYAECRHILASGRKCRAAALKGRAFCLHHIRSRNLVDSNRARNHSIALPPLEDRAAIQMSLDVVLAALAAGKFNRRTAATYVYAIKTAADNLTLMEQLPPPTPIEICRDEKGDILAAEPLIAIQPPNSGAPGLDVETGESTNLNPPLPPPPPNPGAPGPSHLGTGEATVLDLRNSCASQEYDPEPHIPPAKSVLREKRRQIELNLNQNRESLRYWKTIPLSELSEGEDPQVAVNYIQDCIGKLEADLAEIDRLEQPDPETDPPLDPIALSDEGRSR